MSVPESKLSQWRQKFDLLFEHFPEGIIITDSDGIINDMNQNMLSALGFEKDEVMNRSLFDFVKADDREEIQQRFRKEDLDSNFEDVIMDGRWGNQLLFDLTVTGKEALRIVYAREVSLIKRMRQRVQQLTRVINDAADAIGIIDRSGYFILINPAFEKITGLLAEKVLGQSYRILETETNSEIFKDDIRRVFEERDIIRKTVSINHPSGSSWIADIVASPVYDDQGEASFCVIVLRNITRQAELRQALEESELRYRTFIENAQEGIFVEDFDGNILFTNESARKLLGYSAMEMREINVRDLMPSHIIEYLDEFYKLLRQKGKLSYQTQNRNRDDKLIDVDVSANIITLDGKEAILVIVRDISQRVEIEQKLKEYSEQLERRVDERAIQMEKLREIGELLHGSIDLDKLLHLILIAVTAGEGFSFNRAFLLLVDFEEDRLEGNLAVGPGDQTEAARIWTDVRTKMPRRSGLAETLVSYLDSAPVLDPGVNEIVRRLSVNLDDENNILVKALDLGKPIRVIDGRTSIDFDHSIIDILQHDTFVVVPIFWREEAIGVIVCDNSITSQPISEFDLNNLAIFADAAALAITNARFIKELQESQQAHERLFRELNESHFKMTEMKKDAALGRMAATVAHELKTPLVGIGGMARLLLNRIDETDHNFELLKIIADESLRLEYVVERILYFARPKEPIFKEENIERCIQRSIDIFKARTEEKGISIHVNVPDDIPEVQMDEFQIRQVFINLINNSIESMAGEGEIFIDAEHVDSLLCCTVRDTGCGIKKDYLERVFEPFYTSKAKGTGLGLHVSRRIIDKHGGSMELTSKEGKGVTVKVYIPIKHDV